MSMSAEEILVNCEKMFSFLRKDLEFLMNQIKKMLKECSEMDNSHFYEKDLEELNKKVQAMIKDLNENAFEKDMDKDTHVAIETYHEMQRYAERKREEIASFKTEIYKFKQEVVVQEQKQIQKALNSKSVSNFDDMIKEIVAMQKNSNDKMFIMSYLENNKSSLINESFSDVVLKSSNALQEDINSARGMASRIINQNISYYGEEDKEMVESFKDQAKEFLSTATNENIYEKAQEFLKQSAINAENVSIRKDNVRKIITGIRNMGYVVNADDIREIKEREVIVIHAEKVTGEYVDFAVRMDGKFLINSEGFSREDHDIELQSIVDELKKQGVASTEAFNKQYREPAYVAKKGDKKVVKNKTSGSNS